MSALDSLWEEFATAAGVFLSRPDFRFDPDFYADRHPGLTPVPAFLRRHHQEIGAPAGEPATFYAELSRAHPEIDAVLAALVREPRLRAAIAAEEPDALHLACELIRLGAPVDARVSNFSMRGYLAWHPDIERAGMDPLMHYLCHGAEEGWRRTLADLRRRLHPGGRPFDPARPTCLIAVPELSREAPDATWLGLVREAAASHNVVVAALRGGDCLEALHPHVCETVVTPLPLHDLPYLPGGTLDRVDFALLMSAQSALFVHPLVAAQIPFAVYVQEHVEQAHPVFKSLITGLYSDLMVFATEAFRDSWRGRLRDIEFDVARDGRVIPPAPPAAGQRAASDVGQARARLSAATGRDLSGVRLVCGSGRLSWQKGSDIFATVAQICRDRDPDTVFVWSGDGLNAEDAEFGLWVDHQLRRLGANRPEGNLFLLPSGPLEDDLLAAADMLFLSSRLDALPRAAFEVIGNGGRVVHFAGATGLDTLRRDTPDRLISVEHGHSEAAAAALLGLPRKTVSEVAVLPEPGPGPSLFDRVRTALEDRLAGQRTFVRGPCEIDLPILFTKTETDRPLRVREREKSLRYGRRHIWRDLDEVQSALDGSGNWVHRRMRLAPCAETDAAPPAFSIHLHAFYTEDLAEDLQTHLAYHRADRLVVTTDSARKAEKISRITEAAGLAADVRVTGNRGRDILPFLDIADRETGIWCHLHQKRSLASARDGDVWRRFLLRILLGDQSGLSSALAEIASPGTGLVAPFDPHHVGWTASRGLLPKVAAGFARPLPDNPILFPVGNMFWVRQPVVAAMTDLFGPGYPWPNEPIANDGTEYHLIERLWPSVAASLDLDSVFVHKLDQPRT